MEGKVNLGIIVLIIFLFIAAMIVIGSSIDTSSSSYDASKYYVFDAKSMYSNDIENITLTIEELKSKLGEPESSDEWDYDVNSSTKYKITTLTYDNGTFEYHFYDNHLVRVSINKNIEMKKGTYQNLTMFHLTKNDKTTINDTKFALRYYNCGVHDIWFQNIENNVASQVQISYTDLL